MYNAGTSETLEFKFPMREAVLVPAVQTVVAAHPPLDRYVLYSIPLVSFLNSRHHTLPKLRTTGLFYLYLRP